MKKIKLQIRKPISQWPLWRSPQSERESSTSASPSWISASASWSRNRRSRNQEYSVSWTHWPTTSGHASSFLTWLSVSSSFSSAGSVPTSGRWTTPRTAPIRPWSCPAIRTTSRYSTVFGFHWQLSWDRDAIFPLGRWTS